MRIVLDYRRENQGPVQEGHGAEVDEAEAPAQAVRSIITHLQRQKQRRATRSVESPGGLHLTP